MLLIMLREICESMRLCQHWVENRGKFCPFFCRIFFVAIRFYQLWVEKHGEMLSVFSPVFLRSWDLGLRTGGNAVHFFQEFFGPIRLHQFWAENGGNAVHFFQEVLSPFDCADLWLQQGKCCPIFCWTFLSPFKCANFELQNGEMLPCFRSSFWVHSIVPMKGWKEENAVHFSGIMFWCH